MEKNKKIEKPRKWDIFVEMITYVPELIIFPFKLAFRGIVGIYRFWN